jgi:hypothetical protein
MGWAMGSIRFLGSQWDRLWDPLIPLECNGISCGAHCILKKPMGHTAHSRALNQNLSECPKRARRFFGLGSDAEQLPGAPALWWGWVPHPGGGSQPGHPPARREGARGGACSVEQSQDPADSLPGCGNPTNGAILRFLSILRRNSNRSNNRSRVE